MRRPLLLLLAFAPPALAQKPPIPVRAAQHAPPPPQALACPAQPLSSHHFSAGEKLSFHIDAYGADMGTLEVWLNPPAAEERGKVALVAHARAKTSSFVTTNTGGYESFVTARIGPSMAPISAREEVDDSGTHWVHELKFPPKLGKLDVRESKDGNPLPLTLPASPAARDLLSTFFAIRAVSLAPNSPICFEVYAGRHLWKMTGSIGPKEIIDTPLGKISTVRIDLASVRTDDARVQRTAKFWISDDEKRLPVAAIAEFRGKVLRAQLESASGRDWSLGPKAN